MEKVKYDIPTYEQCIKVCEKYDYFQFYKREYVIDGYKIVMFNYRMVDYTDFSNPMGDGSISGSEIRGITYVFDDKGNYKTFPMLKKFYNLNQVEESQYHVLKDIPIKNVYEKLDGSMIGFIKLPNGRVLAKTKIDLDNEMAIAAQNIYETDSNIKGLIDYYLDNDILPVFEYVSPFNRIVLKYNESKLVLLKLRNINTGEYLDIDDIPFDVEKAKIYKYSWEEMLEQVKTRKDFEGWVIMLENDYMLKLKTDWYFAIHRTMTESIFREDFLIKQIVEEEIDDTISKIEKTDQEVLDSISEISAIVVEYLSETKKKVEDLLDKYRNEYNSNMKDFAISYGKKDKIFGFTTAAIKGNDLLEHIKKDLLEYTYRLERARLFLKNKSTSF